MKEIQQIFSVRNKILSFLKVYLIRLSIDYSSLHCKKKAKNVNSYRERLVV